ncbi:hypothetical protein LJ737_22670 [Hymenobacter sp. 15J16-1T3B]|uniref:hypothetical protein n=1 Tax=Hymenobacter sp. 15J16-1T3B TaxID=2886941 RepID=UPI001D103D96|nr:hypothetical protein [Hymenobacter sp. 15J16-1T3B]MCC3160059.1 hypothetical protein [Hymenobacter sp. 15J16-1T3B]
MKTHVYLLLAAGLIAACQRTTETETPTAAAPVAAPRPAAVVEAAPAAAAAPLPPEQLAVLRQLDLAPLLLPASYEDEEGSRSAGMAMNGFFGPEHYRIEFVFTRVERDAQNPALYHISGKDRYKKRITPLEGTIELTKLATLEPLEGRPNGELTAAYAGAGQFELREVTGSGSGVFSGTFALDFGRSTGQKVELVTWGYSDKSMGARGAGSRFEGQWTSNQTKKPKPVLWADGNGLFAIAEDVFADFNVGERGPEINEKYAKLGWNSYWENDEWWAETPKVATVSL